jgi:hypothetical protein
VRKVAVLLILLLAGAGCAARGTPRPVPGIFDHQYQFSGYIDGRHVQGSISFQELWPGVIRYTMSTDAGLCTDDLRPPLTSSVDLRCGGLSLLFARSGRIVERANATLRTTRTEYRRECAMWEVDARGQRFCARYHTVPVEVPVTVRGSVHIQAAAPGP